MRMTRARHPFQQNPPQWRSILSNISQYCTPCRTRWLHHPENSMPPVHFDTTLRRPSYSGWRKWTTMHHSRRSLLPTLTTPDTACVILGGFREQRDRKLWWAKKKQGSNSITTAAPAELIFVLMLQLACSKFMAKSRLKTSLGKLFFVRYNDTSPIEQHKTVVSDENPRVDPDPDLQVISLNKKQSGPMSYLCDINLNLDIGIKIWIKFDADIQT